ncbi:MAG: 3-isopropylmalate dehydratase large subunit [Aminobacterium sp.]|jgi:3-isopropylmalate/(R)-2-methylmalate dehydratase large subunit|nr:3-isopropylmalate dehydratase large subunit [Aminobacterium sp.]MDD3426890.1 3-isopropylmalate dehydratase large subunit [Aminobacterium sp.]MDD3707469.1 3-isopropylmalate dehydratase large subunit [Aminobacterium sp.]MDD4229489.1 3-isopropylmalate dehydratase large subunit [Aminobacterium sp.]MDD4552322.1 3-isopropylmalate dehydratase large subunit [Aminobacterium sp.]
MARTLVSSIIAAHSKESAREGEICKVRVDFAFANDITTPPAVNSFRKMGARHVFDPQRCAVLPDHFTPNRDIASAEQTKRGKEFAKSQNMLYWEVGRVGIEHAFLPEQGYILPGDIVTGADSHTCTGGALGALSTGMGSSDLAAVWALGETWLKVPQTLRVDFVGERPGWITGKDMILSLLGQIGVQGARYMALEFGGEAVENLPMDDRFTISNMAVEAGAKVGIFVPDEMTLEYASKRAKRTFIPIYPDINAAYTRRETIDVTHMEPVVALPHSPDNVTSVSSCHPLDIHQVFIGSCTNGRFRDIEIAALLMKGKKVAENLRCIVIPASYEVYNRALEKGYIQIFANAGAVVCTPTCGPCLGGHMGILAAGERCVSTSNRNFVGRMGHSQSELILASPLVAAASAITGKLTDPRNVASHEFFTTLEGK